jgi:hypothetical protein
VKVNDKRTIISRHIDHRSSLTPDTMTLLVFMYESLPLVRKIRSGRMVEDEFLVTFRTQSPHYFQSVTPSFFIYPRLTSTIKKDSVFRVIK